MSHQDALISIYLLVGGCVYIELINCLRYDMARSSLRQIVFAVLAIYHAGFGCSPPKSWRSKGVSLRAIHADIVILGKVVQSPYPRQSSHAASLRSGLYDARFKVVCTLKGKVRAKYVNVSGFGYIPGHCVNSRALRNVTYITFLRKRQGRYFVAEVNSQVGTTPFKKKILRKVQKRLKRKLNKSRNNCAAFLSTAKKSAKKNNASKTKYNFTATENGDHIFALTMSGKDKSRCLVLKPSWLGVIFVGLHCVVARLLT